MANVITSTTWALDTAAAAAIWSDALWIKEIRWENYNGVPDTAQLTDNADRVVFQGHALASLEPIVTSYAAPFRCYGLKMPTLSSGKIYVSIA